MHQMVRYVTAQVYVTEQLGDVLLVVATVNVPDKVKPVMLQEFALLQPIHVLLLYAVTPTLYSPAAHPVNVSIKRALMILLILGQLNV